MNSSKQHGGKRTGAGRKSSGKQTIVVRIDAELLPIIERIKQHGFDSYNNNQDAIEQLQNQNTKLLEVNTLRVQERDSARIQLAKAKSEISALLHHKTENRVLKEQLNKQRIILCQCLTAKGTQCTKAASHEIKKSGFVVRLCEQHYKSLS